MEVWISGSATYNDSYWSVHVSVFPQKGMDIMSRVAIAGPKGLENCDSLLFVIKALV